MHFECIHRIYNERKQMKRKKEPLKKYERQRSMYENEEHNNNDFVINSISK